MVRQRLVAQVFGVGLLALAVLAAKSAGGEQDGKTWDAGPGASAYGTGSALGGAAAQWQDGARGVLPGAVLAAELSRAAELCARWMGDHAATDIPAGLIEFALRWAGCTDPSATGVVVLTSEVSPSELWERLERLSAGKGLAASHWGFGVAATRRERFRTVWVALLTTRSLALEPIPRVVEPGQSVQVRGQWSGQVLRRPRLIVQSPSGVMREVAAVGDGEGVSASSGALREAGEHVLEVLADGAYGPEVVALFGVWAGAAPATVWSRAHTGPAEAVSAIEAEYRLLELANAERQRQNLEPLLTDSRLQEMARAHSADMAESNFFGHSSPRRGSFEERFRSTGWRVMRAAENLSRSESIAEAHAGLLASPAHRGNLLSPLFTRVGIGVVTRRGQLGRTEYLITQVFALPMQ